MNQFLLTTVVDPLIRLPNDLGLGDDPSLIAQSNDQSREDRCSCQLKHRCWTEDVPE